MISGYAVSIEKNGSQCRFQYSSQIHGPTAWFEQKNGFPLLVWMRLSISFEDVTSPTVLLVFFTGYLSLKKYGRDCSVTIQCSVNPMVNSYTNILLLLSVNTQYRPCTRLDRNHDWCSQTVTHKDWPDSLLISFISFTKSVISPVSLKAQRSFTNFFML